VGSDLHIAGILPGSPATSDTGLVSYYKSGNFDRITMTFNAIKLIHTAYVFMFGDAKREAVKELRTSAAPLDMKPANILKSIPEVLVYSDQI
jgi:6-phosphogluconolactonase/glucosamine-6-phosphate isomerase/deaminase